MTKCLRPLSIKVPIKENDVIIDYGTVKVPCGNCYNCIQTKRAELTGRLMAERETCDIALFVTLSYSDEYLPVNLYGVPSVIKEDVQLFLKRYRKYLDRDNILLRYFCVGEYGDSYNRPHYHLMMFYRYPPRVVTRNNIYKYKDKLEDYLYLAWRYGIIDVGECEQASCHYCSKYMYKDSPNVPQNANKMFFLYSKRPGLGYDFITEQFKKRVRLIRDNDKSYNTFYVNGIKFPLSRFFKRKIFDDDKYKLDWENYVKLKQNQYEQDVKDYNKKFANYKQKYNDSDEFKFMLHYSQDISDDMLQDLKHKQIVKHNIRKNGR